MLDPIPSPVTKALDLNARTSERLPEGSPFGLDPQTLLTVEQAAPPAPEPARTDLRVGLFQEGPLIDPMAGLDADPGPLYEPLGSADDGGDGLRGGNVDTFA